MSIMSDELIETIRTKAREYDETRIYYTLRRMHVRYVTQTQMYAIQIFLALRELGLAYVKTTLFSAVADMEPGNALTLLHRLGDKHVLTLIRELTKTTQPYRYMLSELFLRTYGLNMNQNI